MKTIRLKCSDTNVPAAFVSQRFYNAAFPVPYKLNTDFSVNILTSKHAVETFTEIKPGCKSTGSVTDGLIQIIQSNVSPYAIIFSENTPSLKLLPGNDSVTAVSITGTKINLTRVRKV